MSITNHFRKLKIPESNYKEESKGLKKLWESFDYWIWEKLRHTWFQRNIIHNWIDFKEGIKNLIKYLPIVWKDRDWGDWHILEMLKFKIKNTRDVIIKNNIIINEDLNQINRDCTNCLNLIQKVQDEFYEMEYQEYDIKEWFDYDKSNQKINWRTEDKADNLDKYFLKYKRTYKHVLTLEKYKDSNYGRRGIALQVGQLIHEKAMRILFKIITEKIGFWWD